MSACPACGVAVVPGYIRCPKCHAALPALPQRSAIPPGGTALADGRLPVAAVVVPIVLVLAIVLVFSLRGGGDDDAGPPPAEEPAVPTRPITAPPQATSPTPAAGEAPPRPDPASAIAELERALRRQRLWATVELHGNQIDVRSAACDDTAMAPVIDGAAPALRGVGLTGLRCLAQSGAVVFARDL